MKALRHSIIALLALTLGATLAPAPSAAGVYSWRNSAGGAWDVSGNWSVPGYPRLFFDFAIFDLSTAYSVDATDSLQIGHIAGILVAAGDTRLSAYEGFGGALAISPEGSGGALTLVRGSIDATGMHTIGPGGTLTLALGTNLRSRTTGSIGIDVQSGGTLRGDAASVDGHVLRNLGTVSPGLTVESTGVLLVGAHGAAGYIQGPSGALEIDLAGTAPGAGYDQLRVIDGSLGVVLGGALRVSLAGGFVPAPGDRFEILAAPSYTGAFAAVELPEVQGRTFALVYETGGVCVVVEGSAEITAALDLQPGSCVNPLSAAKQGVLPAVLLGSAELSADDVDPNSIRLEGVAPTRWHLEDIGGPAAEPCPSSSPDGQVDFVMHFPAGEILDAVGPVQKGDEIVLRLTGALRDGTPIVGEDRVTIQGNAKQKASAAPASVPAEMGLQPVVRPRDPVQRVSYTLPEPATVRLEVFSVTGQLVARLVDAAQSAGVHSVEWRPGDRPGGVYFYRLTAGEGVRTARIVLDF